MGDDFIVDDVMAFAKHRGFRLRFRRYPRSARKAAYVYRGQLLVGNLIPDQKGGWRYLRVPTPEEIAAVCLP